MASSGLSFAEIDSEEWRGLRESEHGHHLLQAICRSAVRNSSDGTCGPCTTYIIGKIPGNAGDLIRETFPGSNVNHWSPLGLELTGQTKDVSDELLRRFSDAATISVSKADVRHAVGIATSQGLRQVTRREDFMAFLDENGLCLGRTTFDRAVLPT